MSSTTFALAPGLIDEDKILDYKSPGGKKLYKEATTALPTTFDCEPHDLSLFLSEVDFRAEEYSWQQVLQIPEDIEDQESPKHYLVQEYGLVTLDQVKNHIKTYCGKQSRFAQDDAQLFHCLMASLTADGKRKVLLQKQHWNIVDDDGITHRSGVALLKTIVRISYIDTNATVLSIREALSSLDQYMVEVSSDVEKFNEHVVSQLNALAARGEDSLDMLAHLFKGYEAASDKTFRDYIAKKKDDYQEGKPMSYKHLMDLALNKYNVLQQTKKWNAPTKEEEDLIALKSECESKIKSLDKERKRYIEQQKQTPSRQADVTKSDKSNKRKFHKPAWMLKAPSPGEPEKIIKDGKDYYWCKALKFWARHKPSECRGKSYSPKRQKTTHQSNEAPNRNDNPMKQVANAMAAIQTDDDIDDDE